MNKVLSRSRASWTHLGKCNSSLAWHGGMNGCSGPKGCRKLWDSLLRKHFLISWSWVTLWWKARVGGAHSRVTLRKSRSWRNPLRTRWQDSWINRAWWHWPGRWPWGKYSSWDPWLKWNPRWRRTGSSWYHAWMWMSWCSSEGTAHQIRYAWWRWTDKVRWLASSRSGWWHPDFLCNRKQYEWQSLQKDETFYPFFIFFTTTKKDKIKEAFHIRREQPSLNQQLHHVNLKLSL